MSAARALVGGRARSLEPAQPNFTMPSLASPVGSQNVHVGKLSMPKGTACDGSFQGSPPLRLSANRKRTISVSWTPPGLGRPAVVEAPGFLCWSLRFTSWGRVVPAWGLLSLGFSPTATRGMGRKSPEIGSQRPEPNGREPCSP